MKKIIVALLALSCLYGGSRTLAQNAITLPIAANAVADMGNGPIKVRVIQGNASIFTSQGSGVGSTPGSSTALTLTATPLTPPIVGGLISGNGITSGTTVAAYDGVTNITLSAAMSVPASTPVAWGAACSSSLPAQYIQASVMADYYLLYTQARVCAVSPGGPANTLLVLPVFYDSTTPGGGGGGGGAVSSVFSRTGAVAAQSGDYTVAQVTNALTNVLNSGLFYVGSAGNVATGVAMGGDCTLTAAGTVTCTKTNGVSFAASATTDTTNATNIASGTLNTARLPAPFTSGTRQGNTIAFVTYAGGAPTSGHLATYDANGNVQDGGSVPSGGGSVTSITIGSGLIATPLTITGAGTVAVDFTAVPQKILPPTAKAMATSAIASGACTAAQTVVATGLTINDVPQIAFNGDPHAITGFVPSTSGMLAVFVYPTANTVNIIECNNTTSSITPGAHTFNVSVNR